MMLKYLKKRISLPRNKPVNEPNFGERHFDVTPSPVAGQVKNLPSLMSQPESVMVLAGNIVNTHIRNNEEVSGTRLFKGGAKIYLSSVKYYKAYILDPEDHQDSHIEVVGQHRKSGAWIQSYVKVANLENWRVQTLYKPKAIEKLFKVGWAGFLLEHNQSLLNDQNASPEEISKFLDMIYARYSSLKQSQ